MIAEKVDAPLLDGCLLGWHVMGSIIIEHGEYTTYSYYKAKGYMRDEMLNEDGEANAETF